MIPSRYEWALWKSMEILGVTESIERKIVAAVTIQFGTAVMLAILPFFVSGTLLLFSMFGFLLVAAVAFGNTLLVVRRDFVAPIKRLEEAATTIAAGELDDAELSDPDQGDEIGRLTDAFIEMQEYLRTVSRQADALSDQAFEADVLDETVPGPFGASLTAMADNLRENTRELEALTGHLERTADEYGDVMARAAEKDLSARLDPDTESAAMASIARSFNAMMDDLEATIGDVYRFAETVSRLTGEVSVNVDEIERASGEISDATQEISAWAEDQDDRLQETADEMSSLSATIEEIAASAESVAEVSRRTAEIGTDSQEVANDVLEKMDAVEAQTHETLENLRDLDDRMEEIGDIVDTITDIAEDTNLLALNASIEAARADGHSDGFAVVADEIKSLSEEAQAEATDIRTIIEGIQDQTATTVTHMSQTMTEVETAADMVADAIDSLEQIADNAQDTDDGMQEIKTATDEQAASTEATVSMVNEIKTTSQETASEAATVASAAQEQTASLTEVADHISDLADKADDLMTVLDAFEMTTVEDPVASRTP